MYCLKGPKPTNIPTNAVYGYSKLQLLCRVPFENNKRQKVDCKPLLSLNNRNSIQYYELRVKT